MESIGTIVLYFVVAIAIIVCSVLAVTSRKILRAATYLLFVLVGTAIFYFQLGYEFLGAVQIAVYAGGIMVLFVFSILLTQRPNDNLKLLTAHRRFLGITAALVGMALLGYCFCTFPFAGHESLLAALTSPEGLEVNMEQIGHALLSTEKYGYLLPFEAVSVLLLACIIGGITIARNK